MKKLNKLKKTEIWHTGTATEILPLVKKLKKKKNVVFGAGRGLEEEFCDMGKM